MTIINQPEFQEFPKMARLSREVIITEKIDGTNAQICITDDGRMFVGSRTRWITPDSDNYGFARWCEENREQLLKLGPGRHFGEWWGNGIQRGYNVPNKRLSLFNVTRWCLHGDEPQPIHGGNPKADPKFQEVLPPCVGLVPVIARGVFSTDLVFTVIERLRTLGSEASPGFKAPEGIVVFHVAAGIGFKKTLVGDESPKSLLK